MCIEFYECLPPQGQRALAREGHPSMDRYKKFNAAPFPLHIPNSTIV
jgi:hypothetical protein